MAAILKGTTCKYGIDGVVSNLFVQSYSIASDFQSTQTVEDETGITVTVRYDNRKSVITVDGIAKNGSIPALGDNFTFEVNTGSAYSGGTASGVFTGVVTKIDDKGANKNWTNVSVTAECYEGTAE